MHAHYPVGMSIFQNFQLTLATRRISRTLQFPHKNHSPDFKNVVYLPNKNYVLHRNEKREKQVRIVDIADTYFKPRSEWTGLEGYSVS